MNLRISVVIATALLTVSSAWGQAPYLVTPLQPTSNGGSSNASHFTRVGDAIYFYADPSYDSPAIWKWTMAGGAQRVTTVTNTYYSSSSVYLLALGDKLLFTAWVDSRGSELWITDGTTTTLVKDIYAGGSSSPVPTVVSGTKAYFTAYDPLKGRELWVTDGTEGGTTLVADLAADSASSYPTAFTEAGGKVYFHALNQFWVSDGTQAGTIALASGVSGTAAGVLNGEVFFLGSDAEHGRELWSTDGTVAGTAMVKDIHPGAASSWGGLPTSFVEAGGSLLFFADDAASGRELWSTNGTEAGTQLVEDITPGTASTPLDSLVASSAGAFFVVDNTVLWFSNGTPAGTMEIDSHSRVLSLVAATNGAYFMTEEPALKFSNGTSGGTIEITNVTPAASSPLTADGATVVFSGTNGTSGYDVWVSDGTEAGTSLLVDVVGSTFSSVPSWMRSCDTKVFFNDGNKLWRSDGSDVGTFAVGDSPSTFYYSPTPAMAVLGSTFLYSGGTTTATSGLWKSDGTVAGTSLVKPFYSIRQIFASSGGYAMVLASETTSSYDLSVWLTDGTSAGTIKAAPMGSSYSTSLIPFVDIAGRMYFLRRNDYGYGWREMWASDGTPETTRLVLTGDFTDLASAGGALYVTHYTTGAGRELWKSDGTSDGFVMVKNIAPGNASSDPSNLVAAGNLLYFVARDDLHGNELWRSDGTEAGTFMLKDIRSGTLSPTVSGLVASGAHLYFYIGDSYDRALWRTDGTSAGTIPLTDSAVVSPSAGTAFDTKMMFSGRESFRGAELWESDGSVAGTFVAYDLVPGPASSSPQQLTLARDLLFFVTSTAELWAMPRATTRVSIADRRVTEGDAGSAVHQFTVSRTGATSGALAVNYATENITATAGTDYQAASGTITFAAGETTKTIPITILGDTALEQNESFAVKLISAGNAAVVRDRAFGLIEENDRKVALSIQYVPTYSSSYYGGARTFRITNSGPSGATVSLKISESPFEGAFNCDNKNPSTCSVGFVAAGGSVEFTAHRSSAKGITENGVIPGRTVTASVSATEAEIDLTNNSVTRMVNDAGYISLPPYLIAGGSSVLQVSAPNGHFPATMQPSLSGGVIVSPASVTVTEANPVATMSITVAPNAWGWSTVKNGTTTLMRIPIVLDGEPAKLDTTIVATTNYYSSYYFDHDEPVVIPVRVAATLHDGTRPSGMVTLKKADGSVVQSATVDGEGNATFTLGTVVVGTHNYRVSYAGDTNFHPVTVNLPSVQVRGWSTYTSAVILTQACGDSHIVVTVTNGDDHTPTGSVKLTQNSTVIATLPLVATGTPGEAQATYDYAFGTSWSSVYVTYLPDSPFEASSDWAYYSPSTCPAPTVIATASTSTSVSLIWSDVGASQYEIVRSQGPSFATFNTVDTTAGVGYVDTTAVGGTAYLYKVRAMSSGGSVLSTSGADLATTILFTDDPIVIRQTSVKAVHLNEMQQAANAVRSLANLSATPFAPVTTSTSVDASNITPIRTAIGDAYIALQMGGIVWAEGVASGQVVKTIHMQQLRNMVK